MTYRIISEEDDRKHLAEITMLEEMVAEAERSRTLNHAAAQLALEQRDEARRECLRLTTELTIAKARLNWVCRTGGADLFNLSTYNDRLAEIDRQIEWEDVPI